MSFPWERGFASSSYSMSRSYHNSVIEDYSDSDDEPRNSYIPKQPPKPRTQKPKSQGPKKTLKSRDDYVQKIEFFSCKICKKTYNCKGSLNRHFTTAHGLEKDVKEKSKGASAASKSKAMNTWAPSRRFRCNQCGKELTSAAFLDRHMAIHDRSVKPKAKQTKVSNTNVNINVYNTNNYYNSSMPNNYMNAGPLSIWDRD